MIVAGDLRRATPMPYELWIASNTRLVSKDDITVEGVPKNKASGCHRPMLFFRSGSEMSNLLGRAEETVSTLWTIGGAYVGEGEEEKGCA
eukprot:6160640-Ditylum_brightwellii.AAC.1